MSFILQSVNVANLGLWWRETALAISQSNNTMAVFNISSGATFRPVMPMAGKVVGFNWALDVAITAGNMDVELFINNAEVIQTTLTSASGTSGAVIYTTPQQFTANQTVDYRYSSDGALAGATGILVTALIQFDY